MNLTVKAFNVITKGCDLSPELVRAVIQVESGGNPQAIRYEPAFHKKYVEGSGYPKEDHQLLASSLGIMQVMGLVAREHGFDGDLNALLIPEVGLLYGCIHLAGLQEKHAALEEVVASYNAGSPRRRKDGRFVNQDYVDKVFKAMGSTR